MTIKTFEEIIAWQKAKLLYGNVAKEMEVCKMYSYKDQLLRATLSISNNIAEGFDRGTNKELQHFLAISRGSAAEVRSMILIGRDHGYITNHEECLILAKDISKLLTGFIKSLNTHD